MCQREREGEITKVARYKNSWCIEIQTSKLYQLIWIVREKKERDIQTDKQTERTKVARYKTLDVLKYKYRGSKLTVIRIINKKKIK